MKISIRRDNALNRVAISTAYSSSRGKGAETEETLIADSELLENFFNTATALAAIELSSFNILYSPGEGTVEWEFAELKDNPDTRHTVETLLLDYYTETIIRQWLGLLRDTEMRNSSTLSPLAEAIGKLTLKETEKTMPAPHRHVRRPLFPC